MVVAVLPLSKRANGSVLNANLWCVDNLVLVGPEFVARISELLRRSQPNDVPEFNCHLVTWNCGQFRAPSFVCLYAQQSLEWLHCMPRRTRGKAVVRWLPNSPALLPVVRSWTLAMLLLLLQLKRLRLFMIMHPTH